MKIVAPMLILALAPLAAWGQDGGEGQEPLDWRETAHALPKPPEERNLLAFRAGSQPLGRFLLDSASLSIGEDGVIRYTLVVRGGGASAATFEGLRCASRERKLYASLGRDGAWRPLGNSIWRALDGENSLAVFRYNGNDPRATLAHDYFCDGPVPARASEEIIGRLRGKRVDYLDPMSGAGP
ncbi:MAG: CNP1-like family protein [Azoarcus sp.]|jgi:hypothetical protein|nr:CNP1-like family protein [Azoarcus sp.]